MCVCFIFWLCKWGPLDTGHTASFWNTNFLIDHWHSRIFHSCFIAFVFPYDPSCLSVAQLAGWSVDQSVSRLVGRSDVLSSLPKRAGSYPYMLEHLSGFGKRFLNCPTTTTLVTKNTINCKTQIWFDFFKECLIE